MSTTTPETAELYHASRDLAALVERHTTAGMAGATPGYTLIGGHTTPTAQFAELEARTLRTVWRLAPRLDYAVSRNSRALDQRSAARGLDLQEVTRPDGLHHNPVQASFAAAHSMRLRHAPVYSMMILFDETCVVLHGAPSPHGEDTTWVITHSEVVAAARDLWHRTWAASTPALADGEEPPFTARQVEVADLIVDGLTDRVIARKLGVSPRTVAADVNRLSRLLGAESRAHLAARIAGAGAP